jgi:sugar lactone lactonase YvrE
VDVRLHISVFAMMFALASQLAVSPSFARVEVIDPHALYPEGPLWWHGKLYYVEYAGNGIKTWSGGRISHFWMKMHCGPNGLVTFGHDDILVACYDGNYLVELNRKGREVRTIAKDDHGAPFIGPNDLTSDGHGGVYFSASGVYDTKAPITGKVLHVSADGRSVSVVADTIDYSNGLTLSRNGRELLVAEMLAGRILSFPVGADGVLGPRRVWARLQDLAAPTSGEDAYNGPDGLKLGPDGNYYIAQNGSGRVLVVNGDRKLVRIIDVATRNVTNVAFGPSAKGFAVFITGTFNQWVAPYPGAVYRWTP